MNSLEAFSEMLCSHHLTYLKDFERWEAEEEASTGTAPRAGVLWLQAVHTHYKRQKGQELTKGFDTHFLFFFFFQCDGAITHSFSPIQILLFPSLQ